MTAHALRLLALTAFLGARAGAQTYTLVTEPAQGLAPIYNLIASAKTRLDMTMYELTDTNAEQLLAKAASSGVAVRVILDQNLEKSANTAAWNYLNSHGVQVRWANPAYAATHQKTITVNGSTSAIMTLNLTPRYYSTSRDFAVIENDGNDGNDGNNGNNGDDGNDVAAIEATFDADFNDGAITPQQGDDLAWSPTNSQSVILNIIGAAKRSLLVENEEMSDTGVVKALVTAAGRGVEVQVAMTNPDNDYSSEFNELVAGGVRVSTYPSTAALYIHAKAILADYGSPGASVFIGSENFSSASLTKNRELGLTLTVPAIMQSVNTALTSDFNGAMPWPAPASRRPGARHP